MQFYKSGKIETSRLNQRELDTIALMAAYDERVKILRSLPICCNPVIMNCAIKYNKRKSLDGVKSINYNDLLNLSVYYNNLEFAKLASRNGGVLRYSVYEELTPEMMDLVKFDVDHCLICKAQIGDMIGVRKLLSMKAHSVKEAFYIAAFWHQIDIVEYLIDRMKTSLIDEALIAASSNSNIPEDKDYPIIDFLYDRCSRRESVLRKCVLKAANPIILKKIYRRVGGGLDDALERAVEKENEEMIETLLNMGARRVK